MDLILVRHTNAEDREEFAAQTGQEDGLRPVSEKGRRRMVNVMPNLKKIFPEISLLASSPLVRAVQTVELIRSSYPNSQYVEVPELVPENSPQPFVNWLRSQKNLNSVLAVGHEPQISRLACWLLTGRDHVFCYFKKAGIMHIVFRGEILAGAGDLVGYYPPKSFKSLDLKSPNTEVSP